MSVQHERLIALCNELRLGGIAEQYPALAQPRPKSALRLPTSSRVAGRRAGSAPGAGARNVRAGGRRPCDQDP
jgi:hypothetical protein